ncbi:uncharacterized protein Z520_07703 [Fonsecaea multimorphosa CBS 102226]|uniref:Uncharacterized protein n=1 Tax=Fonsecaea multimorphosa CBS 102226 TaxID=1442371 RepID=A0A0D2JSK2_9EURO|nr:uncharacterized protein Z520_07703 [Fonsecaea multimorphosa CBS 102226]KIX96437.1 hypothetical protein Z520_07703 [Fonsecaea multimorphosa CBS 102226]
MRQGEHVSTFLTFIDAGPLEEARAQQMRREIRSHVARVVVSRHLSSRPTQQPSHKKRRQANPSWNLRVGPRARPATSPKEQPEEPVLIEERPPTPPPARAATSNIRLLTAPSAASMIPASKSPIYHHPLVPAALDNYLKHLAVAVPELDGESQSALLPTLWFPMVLSSPIVFQVIVLFSASHYAARQNDTTLAETLLRFKQCAISGITQALSPASKGMALRDEIIAAVAKMASYEAIFGDESAYHCHMEAVEKMLEGRGGLAALGLEGFLSRLLVFIDTNSAFLLNTPLHLSGSSLPKPANQFIVPPNPSRFIGEV